jgi:uncharacterized repeat protein (TIGR03803 family)
MLFRFWLRNKKEHFEGRTIRQQIWLPRSPARTRPWLEVLEDRIVPSGFKTLYSFTGGNDGSIVQAGVAFDSSGNLYGATKFGGANESGTIYKISPDGTFTTLYASSGGPAGKPLLDGHGNLFGTTEGGGTDNQGTVFEMSTDRKTYATLHNFNGNDGSDPEDALVMDSKGDLFGTTWGGGGVDDSGTVFELSPNGSGGYNFQTLHAFSVNDGINIIPGVYLDSKGDLFGQTAQGTPCGFGTVYELSPNGSGGYDFTVLHTFTGGSDGRQPVGGLIMNSSGNLYGTTEIGNTVFELNPTTKAFTTLYTFDGSHGDLPQGDLLMDAKGNLYGTTTEGTSTNAGTVFELSPNGSGTYTITNLYNFGGGNDGSEPFAGLTAYNGNLYGTTSAGGLDDKGTVFELTGVLNVTTSGTVSNGQASVNYALPAGTTAGTYTIDAVYNPGPDFSSSSNKTHTLTVTPAKVKTTAVNASAFFSPNAQTVTLNANVADSTIPSDTVEEGTVTFTIMSGQTVIGSPVHGTVSGGKASADFTLPAGEAAGDYTIAVSYSDSKSNLSDSNDTNANLTIAPAKISTTAVNASTPFSPNAQTVKLDATIADTSIPSDTVEEGTVTFTVMNGQTVIGTPVQGKVSGGNASASIKLPAGQAAGTYTIDVSCSDSKGNFSDIQENSATLTVSPANVITTANNATLVIPHAQTISLGASVLDASIPWDTVDEGVVTFTIVSGQTVIGKPVQGTVSGGKASANFSWPAGQAAGDYTIAVSYSESKGNFSDSGDTSATLTVQLVPTVTTNPSNQTVTAGQTATFTAAASGDPTPMVQWQVSTDGGINFSDISGATSTTLTLNNVLFAQNGDDYRAIFTNSVGTATTSDATLIVQTAPAVTTNPSKQAVIAGQPATFTAAANGNPTPTVQWQVSSDSGRTFTDISGATSTSLKLSNALFSLNGDEYRAVFSNSVGAATTSAATLIVQTLPAVTTEPSDETVTAGQPATFTAAASGNPTPTTQWQISNDNGHSWTNISGATSAALTLSNASASFNGDEYRAVLSNSVGVAMTTAATLTVQTAPTATTNPSNQTVTEGETATFTAAAAGNPTPTVQWQVSADGGKTFTDISGATSTMLTLSNVLFSQNGDEYRASFTNSVGTATTSAASLTVQMASGITSGKSTVFTAGQFGSFTVTATGSPTPTFTETGALPRGVLFTNNGNGTASLAGAPALGTQGTYHFTITAHNGIGNDATQSFTLTVNPAPVPPSPPSTPPSSPPQPPALNVPPLLALIYSLLGSSELVNTNGTETVTNGLFGFTLIVATYDSSGNFVYAVFLGIDVPNWVWFV